MWARARAMWFQQLRVDIPCMHTSSITRVILVTCSSGQLAQFLHMYLSGLSSGIPVNSRKEAAIDHGRWHMQIYIQCEVIVRTSAPFRNKNCSCYKACMCTCRCGRDAFLHMYVRTCKCVCIAIAWARRILQKLIQSRIYITFNWCLGVAAVKPWLMPNPHTHTHTPPRGPPFPLFPFVITHYHSCYPVD